MACVMDFTVDTRDDTTMHQLGDSPVITDSKDLYDASRSPTAGLGITEKRASIEVDRQRARESNRRQLEVGEFSAADSRWSHQGCRKTALRGGVAQEQACDQVCCQLHRRAEVDQRAEGRRLREALEAHVAVPTVIPEEQRCCKPSCLKPSQTGGHKYCTGRYSLTKLCLEGL